MVRNAYEECVSYQTKQRDRNHSEPRPRTCFEVAGQFQLDALLLAQSENSIYYCDDLSVNERYCCGRMRGGVASDLFRPYTQRAKTERDGG